MRLAVLGTGDVGNRIATKLISLGHEVKMGSRTGTNLKAARGLEMMPPVWVRLMGTLKTRAFNFKTAR